MHDCSHAHYVGHPQNYSLGYVVLRIIFPVLYYYDCDYCYYCCDYYCYDCYYCYDYCCYCCWDWNWISELPFDCVFVVWFCFVVKAQKNSGYFDSFEETSFFEFSVSVKANPKFTTSCSSNPIISGFTYSNRCFKYSFTFSGFLPKRS